MGKLQASRGNKAVQTPVAQATPKAAPATPITQGNKTMASPAKSPATKTVIVKPSKKVEVNAADAARVMMKAMRTNPDISFAEAYNGAMAYVKKHPEMSKMMVSANYAEAIMQDFEGRMEAQKRRIQNFRDAISASDASTSDWFMSNAVIVSQFAAQEQVVRKIMPFVKTKITGMQGQATLKTKDFTDYYHVAALDDVAMVAALRHIMDNRGYTVGELGKAVGLELFQTYQRTLQSMDLDEEKLETALVKGLVGKVLATEMTVRTDSDGTKKRFHPMTQTLANIVVDVAHRMQANVGSTKMPKLHKPVPRNAKGQGVAPHYTADMWDKQQRGATFSQISINAVNEMERVPFTLWNAGVMNGDIAHDMMRAELNELKCKKNKSQTDFDKIEGLEGSIKGYKKNSGLIEILAQVDQWFSGVKRESRGRFHYSQSLHNMQGGDWDKSVLRFGRSKPIGKRGWDNLLLALSELAGLESKESKKRRIAVAKAAFANLSHITKPNREAIDWVVTNFEGCKKFQTVGIICEMNRIQTLATKTNQDVADIPSNFILHQDASINGIQHVAAVMRHQGMGQLVNIIAQMDDMKPKDLYLAVAEKAIDELSASLTAEQLKLVVKYKRFFGKELVMRAVYGVQPERLMSYIRGEIIAKGVDEAIAAQVAQEYINAITHVAPALFDFVEKVRILTQNYVTTSGAMDIIWDTVEGAKPCYNREGIDGLMAVGDGTFRFAKATKSSDRLSSAMGPNFIHSIDAAHLALVLNALMGMDVDTHMIHDSIGCHVCDVDLVNTAFKEQFVELHKFDWLGSFAKALGKESMNLPKGDLDIEDMKKSVYSFSA